MSFISDFAALARAGYKASDIKELIELSNRSQPETSKAAVVEEPAEIRPEEDWQPEQEKTVEKPAEDPDEISAYKSEIEDLKRQLAEAQKSNVSADISANNNKTDPQTQLTEILQNLL